MPNAAPDGFKVSRVTTDTENACHILEELKAIVFVVSMPESNTIAGANAMYRHL